MLYFSQEYLSFPQNSCLNIRLYMTLGFRFLWVFKLAIQFINDAKHLKKPYTVQVYLNFH